MTDFARLVLDVDTKGLRDGERDLNSFSQTASRSVAEVGRSMQRIGAGMTVGVTAPLALFGVTSIKAASDAAELQSAFNQTFGEMASSMNKWAEDTGNAMNRSTQAMQRLANSYGLFFNNLPVAREEAARMSRVFAELTQDFASFHNLTEDEAMSAFRSGLAGETEALRRYGIDISAAAVETRALAMGLAETSKALTEQDKILARYNLILDGTKNAQGDVARTFDGTANQMRGVQEAADELQVTIGEKLLPAVTPLITAADNLLKYFGTLPSGVQTTIVAVAALAAALGPLLMVFGSILIILPTITGKFAALGLGMGPLLLIMGGLAAAGALIYANWDKIGPVLRQTAETVKNQLGPTLIDTFNRIKETVIALWEGPFGDALRTAGKNLMELGSTIGSVLGPVALSVLRGFASLVGTAFETIGNILNTVISLLSGDFTGAWEGVKTTVGGIIRGLFRLVEAVFPGIGEYAYNLYLGLKGWLQDRMAAVWNWVIDKIETVKNAFATLYDAVVGNSYIPDMVDEIGTHMRRLDVEMLRPARTNISATEQAFRDLQQSVSDVFARLFPDRQRTNQFIADLDMLEQAFRRGVISARQYAEARARLREELQGGRITGVPAMVREMDLTIPETQIDMSQFGDASAELLRQWGYVGDQMKAQNVRIVESFSDLAKGVLGEIQNLAASIKGGNFLNIFESVLNAFTRLGGMGVFGSGVQNFLRGTSTAAVPSFAGGGYTGSAPRTGGMDGRGGFLAMLHPRETVVDHTRRGANDNRGMVFNVDARGATDPEAVRQQVQLGILEAAPAIVAAAEQRTISNLRRPRLAGVL